MYVKRKTAATPIMKLWIASTPSHLPITAIRTLLGFSALRAINEDA